MDKDGIYPNLSDEDYHADPHSISKTGLFKLYDKTPAHYKFAPDFEYKATMEFGKAVHLAILEPHLTKRIIRGPADRRGNKWKDAMEAAASIPGSIVLPSDNYDEVFLIQKAAREHPIIKQIADSETIYEASAFWTDTETGLQCRCRPDVYIPERTTIADLKTTLNANGFKWARIRTEESSRL